MGIGSIMLFKCWWKSVGGLTINTYVGGNTAWVFFYLPCLFSERNDSSHVILWFTNWCCNRHCVCLYSPPLLGEHALSSPSPHLLSPSHNFTSPPLHLLSPSLQLSVWLSGISALLFLFFTAHFVCFLFRRLTFGGLGKKKLLCRSEPADLQGH